jgi:CheY-like chemotaxis protein/nitrogen-specific signal transduction histidine kinase
MEYPTVIFEPLSLFFSNRSADNTNMALAELVAPSEAQKVDRIKRNFLASLNHELRTPLTGILGMLDLLTETPLSEEQKDYVNSSRSCAELLLESITNAIEYSSLTNGTSGHTYSEFRPAEMLQAAVSAREPKARSKGLHLSLLLDPQLPELALSDPHRVRQILDVLLSNAIKFTPAGEIEVIASAAPQPDGRMWLSVSVRDSGPGIAADQLPSLFGGGKLTENPLADPSPGLRVGLPLAKQITEAMGGTLQVESYPAQGSLFTFTIPISRAAAEIPAPPVAEPAERKTARVLLVEDNTVAQRFMTTLLERRGYTVALAPDGMVALQLAEQQPFDLVLMDLQMPGIDGLETARRLRQTAAAANVPIIACTANPSSEVRAECTAAGMNDFLSKPVNSAELFTVLERYGGLRWRSAGSV